MYKLRFVHVICLFVGMLFTWIPVFARQETKKPDPTPQELTSQALALDAQGKKLEAFALFFNFPGGESYAAKMATTDPKTYLAELDRLEATSKNPRNPRFWLVRGDLLMALGKNKEALAAFRKFVAAIGKTPDQTWDKGWVPSFYYPLSPTILELQNGVFQLPLTRGGMGSHADNWLIQRFLTLGAWDDAAKEFERMWKVHQLAAQGKQLFGPGLRFALEYAFFLTKSNQPQKSWDLLLNVFLQLDLEQNPGWRARFQSFQNQTNQATPLPVDNETLQNLASAHSGYSQSEFIRLAYGYFQLNNQTDVLKQALERQIRQGRNQARWVLARILQLEGNEDQALATELEYVRQAGFTPFTVTYRSGLIYERYNRLREATALLEQTLQAGNVPISIPDPDDVDRLATKAYSEPGMPTFFTDSLREKVFNRLVVDYFILGETEKALAAESRLRGLQSPFGLPRSTAPRKEQTSSSPPTTFPSQKFELDPIPDDPVVLIQALAALAKQKKMYEGEFKRWKAVIASRNKDLVRPFLNALFEADPKNPVFLFALLKPEGDLITPGSLVYWFNHLKMNGSDGQPPFYFDHLEPTPALLTNLEQLSTQWIRPNDSVTRQKFYRNSALAYALMRLYEKTGQVEKMLPLALKLAQAWSQADLTPFSFNRIELFQGNTALTIAIQHLNRVEDQKTLLQALESSPWEVATTQLKRVIAGQKLVSDPKPNPPWANTPQGIQVFGGHENVLSLCRDQKQVYVGYPWGVAVYNFSGQLLTQVALECAASHLTVIQDTLWVGTELGVRRVDLKTYAVSGFPCDQELSEKEKREAYQTTELYNNRIVPIPSRREKINAVTSLARQGHILWISTQTSLRKYDTLTSELRVYPFKDLTDTSSYEKVKWLIDRGYIWVQIGQTSDRDENQVLSLRYDPATDSWTKPQSPLAQAVQLVGLINGNVWATLFQKEKTQIQGKLCLIDSQTLNITPVEIETSLSRPQSSLDGRVSFYGHWQGKFVFETQGELLLVDPTTRKASFLRNSALNSDAERQALRARQHQVLTEMESDLPLSLRTGRIYRLPDGGIAGIGWFRPESKKMIPLDYNPTFCLRLPDNSAFVGCVTFGGDNYAHPDYEFRSRYQYQPQFFGQSGGLGMLSAEGDFRLLTKSQHWGTIWGDYVNFVVPDSNHNRIWVGTNFGITILNQNFQVLGNLTTRDGLASNLVMAGAMGQQLAVVNKISSDSDILTLIDPKTNLLTSLSSFDGLPPLPIKSVDIEGQKLKVEYWPKSINDLRITASPGFYDFQTHRIERSLVTDGTELKPGPGNNEEGMPYLGGRIQWKKVIDGKTFVLGTRGLMILPNAVLPKMTTSEWPVKFSNPAPTEPKKQATSPQASAQQPIENILVSRPVPAQMTPSPGLSTYFQADHHSPFQPVSLFASPRLVEKRIPVDQAAQVKHPCGSAITPDSIQQLINRPFVRENNDTELCFYTLGTAVSENPDLLKLLLNSQPQSEGYFQAYRNLLKRIFSYANKRVVSTIHQALASPNMLVRRNAAYACAGLKDPASIPLLIQALKTESGLVRAGVVWALGELKAHEAVPALMKIYFEGFTVGRRFSLGFRTDELNRDLERQYQKLKVSTVPVTPPFVDYSSNWSTSWLLDFRTLDQALIAIGPQHTQPYIRLRIYEDPLYGSAQALMQYLADCPPAEVEHNKGICRHFAEQRSLSAAVNLIIWGDQTIEPVILDWLKDISSRSSPTNSRSGAALSELTRVKDKSQLRFARPILLQLANDPSFDSELRKKAQRLAQE
ncbi:MAG: HEAT repeat domain-containing protein [Acidobacteria bacterium]|nr:HEAT repeat domain-containing protein [Acidobacteriota bacterium]